MQTLRGIGLVIAIFSAAGLFAPTASAAIISITDQQSCNVIGLDASPSTAQGGVHCAPGNVGFSLSSILSGNIALFVGNSQTPSWNIINDTGAIVTDLKLFYSGALDPGSFIDMQLQGGTAQGWFDNCTAKTATNVSTTTTNDCNGTETTTNPALPLEMHWLAGATGTGISAGTTFDLHTASFAHAGADAGCISGTATCTPVPEPGTLALLATGLLATALARRRRRS
jgi:hypothetical protein